METVTTTTYDFTGYYVQHSKQHPVKGTMVVSDNGTVTATSTDEVGSAKWDGTYDPKTGEATLNKHYDQKHSVVYKGILTPPTFKGTYHLGSHDDEFSYTLVPATQTYAALGYYVQKGKQHPAKATFVVSENGTITGSGIDEVGPASWEGTYDKKTGEASLKKHYDQKHSVDYKGTLTTTTFKGKYHLGHTDDEFSYTLTPFVAADKVSKWVGFYVQNGVEVPMEVSELHVKVDASIVAHTTDEVGEANWTGSYCGKDVTLTKQYVGKHSVSYKGTFNKAETEITGKWTLDDQTDSFKLTEVFVPHTL